MVAPALVQHTFEVVERLEAIIDAQTLFDEMSSALEPFGFTAFVLTRLPRTPGSAPPPFLINGWPAGWAERYAEVRHDRHDPLARHCLSTSEVFSWSEIPEPLLQPEPARRVVREAAEFALNDGYCVPLHTALGVGGLSLAGERLELPPGARHMLRLLAFQACLAVERLPVDRPPGAQTSLSPRERDVLSWTAGGKTAPEIGEILGISAHTVGEHLRHVRRKLNTSNNAHSVAEALRSGDLKL